MAKVTMTVNGKSVTREVEGRTLLSAFLREGLNLTGTHVGCDTSQCGACTVHLDGKQVKSCTVFAVDAAGGDVRTIEGMANKDGTLSRLQQAFQDHHGLQCGFCTPGMVMAAAALLEQNPKPTEAECVITLRAISAAARAITTSSRRCWRHPGRMLVRSQPNNVSKQGLARRP